MNADIAFVSEVEQAIVIVVQYVDGPCTDIVPDTFIREAASLLYRATTEERLESLTESLDQALARRAEYARSYIIGPERNDERDNRLLRLSFGETAVAQ